MNFLDFRRSELPASDFCISERFSLVFTQKGFCLGAKQFYGKGDILQYKRSKGLDDGKCMFPEMDLFF